MTKICHYCWTEVPAADYERHQSADHPGMSKRWGLDGKSRILTIIDPAGKETVLSANEVTSQYRRLRSYRKGGAPVPARVPRAVPPAEPGDAVDSPEPAPLMRDNAPIHRIRQMAPPAAVVTRGAVEAAFTREFLAGLLVTASRILSDADGAGPDGVFSQIEAAQIASLLYDPSVSFIIDRFGGNVDKFKMYAAGAIILGGRGRVHARAILLTARTRAEANRARNAKPVETPEREAMISSDAAASAEGNGHSPETPADGDYWSEMYARQNPGARRAHN
jgi:hypothetical protein